jgi:glycosyltransferase involved in cell wall biosynthesis
MGELVKDGINGFTFKHRSTNDLTKKLQWVLDNPEQAAKIAKRGYLRSADGSIHEINDHIQNLLRIFEKTAGDNRL